MNRKTLSLEIIQSKISDVQLESVLNTLDRLHDAATEQALASESSVEPKQIIGWLEDIIFTAQETLKELQSQSQSERKQLPGNSVVKLYRQG